MWLGELLARTKLLLSTYNFGLSNKALRLHLQKNTPPAEVDFDPDGYLHYIAMENQVAAGTFKLNATQNLANYTERYNVPPTLNPVRVGLFELLLIRAQEKGIKVRLFATPFHPDMIKGLKQVEAYNQVQAAALPYLQALPSRFPNVTFHDLTDVASFGGDPNGFFDGVHYRQENGRLMLETLYNN
jgi:hypothetical protein